MLRSKKVMVVYKISKILLLNIQILQSCCNLKNAQKLQKKPKKILFSLFVPVVLMLTKHEKLKKIQT
jgi:hypothetical protein